MPKLHFLPRLSMPEAGASSTIARPFAQPLQSVRRSVTGKVRDGVFTSDQGFTYKVSRRGGGRVDLTIYEGLRIRIVGFLISGAVLYPTRAPVRLV